MLADYRGIYNKTYAYKCTFPQPITHDIMDQINEITTRHWSWIVKNSCRGIEYELYFEDPHDMCQVMLSLA
jgi:hypothetical protein